MAILAEKWRYKDILLTYLQYYALTYLIFCNDYVIQVDVRIVTTIHSYWSQFNVNQALN